eukprot:CAMPEP_0206223058 /NCGR_PEP_ID=MMETSP0047_2-20121206/6287_1 /ASSEMBLY_ACC=CAM_ASM_000192 /TAXON_ID=195065 /ORGANISM="Chroomonas mesostigmatica_cf, Strain CCMP1168" /LENGTH=192 /DNA_ID=CAMNT_0053645917 /DNA_START=127 /DNA_END=707 /DNA_ORIENTATION=-
MAWAFLQPPPLSSQASCASKPLPLGWNSGCNSPAAPALMRSDPPSTYQRVSSNNGSSEPHPGAEVNEGAGLHLDVPYSELMRVEKELPAILLAVLAQRAIDTPLFLVEVVCRHGVGADDADALDFLVRCLMNLANKRVVALSWPLDNLAQDHLPMEGLSSALKTVSVKTTVPGSIPIPPDVPIRTKEASAPA